MVCIRSRTGCVTRQTRGLCAAHMPSGTPTAMESAVAKTTSTSVWTVSFHRAWLMMNRRPIKTETASGRDLCSQ